MPRRINLKERNFKNFNEREFVETILLLNGMKFYNLKEIILIFQLRIFTLMLTVFSINLLLIKKVPKKEFKLKSKPWITKDI